MNEQLTITRHYNRIEGSLLMATNQKYNNEQYKNKLVDKCKTKKGFIVIDGENDYFVVNFDLRLYLLFRWVYFLIKKFKKEPLYVEPLKEKMKRMQFVEDFKGGLQVFTRGFTRIYVQGNDYFIGHTINKNKTKVALQDIDSYIKYFDRI